MPIEKPASCQNCPFYEKSKYITPDWIIPDSKVTILAQAPGKHEEEGAKLVGHDWIDGKRVEQLEAVKPQPLIGASGNWLQNEFWPLTRIPYDSVSRANVIKCRPYNSNELPNIGSNKPMNGITVKELKLAIDHCVKAHLNLGSETKYILSMGEVSLYALTGEELLNYKKDHGDIDETTGKKRESKSTISEWRGWCLGKREGRLLGLFDYYHPTKEDIKIFPVVHLASLFQSDKYYHATLLDFIRFGKLVRNEWPESVPDIKINTIPPSIPSTIGFDTEYTRDNILTMWSLADVERNIYVVDAEYSRQLINLPERLTIVTQNGLVDMPHFLPLLPEEINVKITLEDCMLAHSTLWTGELNSLDYQLSKVGLYNRHKHLRETNDAELKYFYAALDADSTLNFAWKHCIKEFSKDKLSYLEYKLRRQPLLYIINRFQERGVEVWKERVNEAAKILDEKMERIQNEAKELTGNEEFNIRSNEMVKRALYANDFISTRKAKVKKQKRKSAKDFIKEIEDFLKTHKQDLSSNLKESS